MSMPHFYHVFDAADQKLGQLYTGYFSYFPLSRTREKEAFDAELGELIVTDLAVYCAGKQEKTPEPKFTLAEVSYIVSDSGDKVPVSEFGDCIAAYIRDLREVGKNTDRFEGVTAEAANDLIMEAEEVKLFFSRPGPSAPQPVKQEPRA